MKKQRIIELAVKVLVAALTAFLTAISTTSCLGHGPIVIPLTVRNLSHTRGCGFLLYKKAADLLKVSGQIFYRMVEVTGLEPATAWSQTRNATNCATPRLPESECKGTHFLRTLQTFRQIYLIIPCSTKIFFKILTERSTCSSVWVAIRA